MPKYRVRYEKVEVMEVEVELEHITPGALKAQTYKHHYGLRPTAFYKHLIHLKDLDSGTEWYFDDDEQMRLIQSINPFQKGPE